MIKADFQLTENWQECDFRTALQTIGGLNAIDEVHCDDRLVIIFENNIELAILNWDEPQRYSDVMPDLQYDPPHVLMRRIQQENLTSYGVRKNTEPIRQPNVPFFDNTLGGGT